MMSKTAQTLSLFFTVFLSYFWISIPSLQHYSLQLTAALVLIYVGVKWQTKIRSTFVIFPSTFSLDITILFTAVLLLVGSTGGISSIFIPMIYVLAFFSVISLDLSSVFIITSLSALFLYAVTPHPFSSHQIATLLLLVICIPVFLFVKTNHDQLKEQEQQASVEKEEIIIFLSTYLKPKMSHLEQLAQFVQMNEKNIVKQIHGISDEIDAFIEKAKHFMEQSK